VILIKFYIASRLGNYAQVQALAGRLKAAGWVHTFDWTADWVTQGSAKETSAEALKSIAEKELEGVSGADVVIVLTPQGRGTHTEFGIAVALNKIVFLCHSDNTYFSCDDNSSSFYYLPQVIQVIGTTEEIAEKVLDLSFES
jgi:nucleoside 2-deoxyribosyltransferase